MNGNGKKSGLRWSNLPSNLVASMLGGHLTLGLAASILLYVLCVSGTAMVFHDEFWRWEQPDVPEMTSVTPEAAGRAARAVLGKLDEAPHHFYVGPPGGTLPRLWVSDGQTTWYANEDGQIVARADHVWSDFLEKLHYYLTMPTVPGLTLVGILGVLMAGLCLSGLLAHPRLFRDAFRLRLKSSPHLAQADLHNRLSVWAFPFHFVIAVTGAALGLSILVAAAFAPAVNEGNTTTFFDPIFGAESEGSDASAPLADFEGALAAFAEQHPDESVWLVSFHDPGTEGQSAEILARHPDRLIFGEYFQFDTAGRLTGQTGLADGDIGQQVVASLYPLHFGTFGGLVVKLAYGLLGLAACVVVASGLNIWLVKRRKAGRAAPAMERAWTATVWGCPAVLAAVAITDLAIVQSLPILVATFWIGQAGLIVLSMALPGSMSRSRLQAATALFLALTVAWHTLRFSLGESPAGWGVSGVLIVMAVIFGWLAVRGRSREVHEQVA